MRPPSHPADTCFGPGLLYEPGAHTLLFTRSELSPSRLRMTRRWVPRVVRLPWLFVDETLVFGNYLGCHALTFADDPRDGGVREYVSLATILGNALEGGRTCVGNVYAISADADLWNTAFTNENLVDYWAAFCDSTRRMEREYATDGVTRVTGRSET